MAPVTEKVKLEVKLLLNPEEYIKLIIGSILLSKDTLEIKLILPIVSLDVRRKQEIPKIGYQAEGGLN